VTGKLPPVTENPVPEIESDLIVTATVPFEVTVTDFVTAVPTETLPNASELALKPNAAVAAFNCSATLFVEELAVAVTVADCAVLTDPTVAVNEAVEAPEGTVTLPGTDTADELLVRATLCPLDSAAELNETVHAVVPDPVNELEPQDNAATVGAIAAVAPLNWIDVFCEIDPCVAVRVTVCSELTESTVAMNVWLDAPAATVTEAGTVTALLLLAR